MASAWDDKPDEHTVAIAAAHPLKQDTTASHERYARALKMVENRHSKYALVDLVHWLLTRAETAEAEADI